MHASAHDTAAMVKQRAGFQVPEVRLLWGTYQLDDLEETYDT